MIGFLSGVYPLACLALAPLYPVSNRVWGGDPIFIKGRKIGSHSAAIILLLLIGVPAGFLSKGLGGALVPLLFGAWRAIIIAKDWATPDTPKEIILAFVRHAIPAAIVAAWTGVCTVNGTVGPFNWILVCALVLHALAATGMAILYASAEAHLGGQLARGEISQAVCDADIAEANAHVEFGQGLTFAAAVIAWTLLI